MATLWIILIVNVIMTPVLCSTPDELEAERSGWNVDPQTQYHIQTDEGPERYFRFQTLNGQFRKEKRLEDGTVIGTEGWLDPLGYLRIKDYIADSNGYRILRSKNIFVGKDKSTDDAVSISRRLPAQTGILVQPRRPPNPFRQSAYQEFTDNSIEGAVPIKPTYRSNVQRMTVVPPIAADETYNELTKPLRNYSPYQIQTSRRQSYRNSYYSPSQISEPAQEIEPPINNYRNIRQYRTGRFNNNNNNIARERSDLYEEFPPYDGTHTVSNGFQYYLKRQYHEEEQKPDEKVGSFGYIDPFGIRRVIYYKTDDNNGFLHKKNNRYVGLAATPYDPLPIKSSN